MSAVTSAAIQRADEDIEALIATHGSGKLSLAELGERYDDDPLGFCRDVLHLDLQWDRLEDVLLSVRDHALTAVPGAVACGKDFAASALALWWVYCRSGLVVLTAPTERQAFTIMMPTIARLFARAPGLPGTLYSTRLDVPGSTGAGILTVIGSRISSATGYHHAHLLAILSEAQGCEPHSWEAALSNASTETSRILAVGNPLFASGDFFRVCHDPDWRVVTLDALEHPNLTGPEVVIGGGAVTRALVQRIESHFGADSPQYLARVRGQFPSSDEAGGLVKREWLTRAHEHYRDSQWGSHEAAKAQPVLGVDVARLGSDDTICVLRRGPRVFAPHRLPPGDTMETAAAIVHRCHQLGLDPIRDPKMRVANGITLQIDAIGIGAGVYDRLVQLGMNVQPFNASNTARLKPKEFANLRAEAYWQLRKMLEEDRIALPDDDLLTEELLATRWDLDSSGRIQIESKDALSRRLKPQRSPDRADALSIAVAAGYTGVTTFSNPF